MPSWRTDSRAPRQTTETAHRTVPHRTSTEPDQQSTEQYSAPPLEHGAQGDWPWLNLAFVLALDRTGQGVW
jgi:hypothetical protein